MSVLDQYAPEAKKRIAAIASQLVISQIEGMIANGAIQADDDASIDAAAKTLMPQAVHDARQVFSAAEEYVRG